MKISIKLGDLSNYYYIGTFGIKHICLTCIADFFKLGGTPPGRAQKVYKGDVRDDKLLSAFVMRYYCFFERPLFTHAGRRIFTLSAMDNLAEAIAVI